MLRTLIVPFFIFSFLNFSSAWAFPQYSVKEGKDCIYCHNHENGGPTNARGRYYADHLTLEGYVDKIKKVKKPKKLKKPSVDTDESESSLRLRYSISLRAA